MDNNKIEKRIRQLDAQKQRLKSQLRSKQRATETRRKILIGALVLSRIEQNDFRDTAIIAWVKDQLPSFLTRHQDREIFSDILENNTNDGQNNDPRDDHHDGDSGGKHDDNRHQDSDDLPPPHSPTGGQTPS